MNRGIRIFYAVALSLMFVMVLAVSSEAQEDGFRVYYKDGFKMQSADKAFKFHIGGRIQTDLRITESDFPTNTGFRIRRARLFGQGTFFKIYEFKVQNDFGGGKSTLKDAYIKVHYRPEAVFKFGQFKEPFSLEELTSSKYVDFVERTMIIGAVAPSRDIGVLVEGKPFDKALYYGLGVFNGNGSNKSSNDSNDLEFAGRVVISPFRKAADSPLKKLSFGGAVTFTDRPSGAKSFKGKSNSGITFFHNASTAGNRTRWEAELQWLNGPFSLKSEYMFGKEDRDGLAAGGANYPELETKGWYVTGTWLITGQEKKTKRNEGVEVALRYEDIEFDDGSGPLTETGANALTVGLNWYINRMTVVRLDYVREDYDDPASAGLTDDTANVFLSRFQMEF